MLTLQFVPYAEIEQLSSKKRIRKLLDIAKKNRIVILEGRLRKSEEAELIQITMEQINSKFKGIELAVVYPESTESGFVSKVKTNMANILLGNRQGLTVIGPATLVTEIVKDPEKIQLFTKESRKSNGSKRGRRSSKK
ncbi:DUF2073 domain-containing protein [Candidatus Woesearchaeota archaeon]|nr:DUF2073 domain-containing protein [Candidatus Woesearchaeota archaeon]